MQFWMLLSDAYVCCLNLQLVQFLGLAKLLGLWFQQVMSSTSAPCICYGYLCCLTLLSPRVLLPAGTTLGTGKTPGAMALAGKLLSIIDCSLVSVDFWIGSSDAFCVCHCALLPVGTILGTGRTLGTMGLAGACLHDVCLDVPADDNHISLHESLMSEPSVVHTVPLSFFF